MKIKVAVLEKDTMYLNRVVATFNNNFSEKLEVYSFTNEDVALQNLGAAKIDVFLANDQFEIERSSIPKRCGFAYLVESPEIESVRGEATICKFQKIELIYKEVLGIFYENTTNVTGIKLDDDSTQMYCFFPISGGVGASTAAVACAKYIAKHGKRVLYMNLDPFADTKCYFSADGTYDFSDVIYAVKSKRNNISVKLESTVKQDSSGVYYYESSKMVLDHMELTAEELEILLQTIKMTGAYDYIILDSNFDLCEGNKQVLKIANRTVLVSDGSNRSNVKFERIFPALQLLSEQREWNLEHKVSIFYNKFSNKTSRPVPVEGLKNLGGVPRFENATSQQVINQFIEMNVFESVFA